MENRECYYDFLFYVKNRIKPNLIYLRNKLIENGKLGFDDDFNLSDLKTMRRNNSIK